MQIRFSQFCRKQEEEEEEQEEEEGGGRHQQQTLSRLIFTKCHFHSLQCRVYIILVFFYPLTDDKDSIDIKLKGSNGSFLHL